MLKLYLLGGENVFKQSAREVNERAFHEAGESPVVLVFPWARASFDKTYKKRKELTDYFISLGARSVDFVDYPDSKENIAQKISASNLIYLTGGLVTALCERLTNMGVDSLLRDFGGVIVGRSAGALVLCERCVITNRHSRKVTLFEGLGLSSLTFKAHYKPENDAILQLLSKGIKIYAVPASSALVYENGNLSFIGKAYIFENGAKHSL